MKIENISSGFNFQRFFIANVWVIPLLVSIGTFTAEYIDHHHEGALLNNSEFLREAFIFSVLFPLFIGVIVYSLRSVVRERESLSSEMDSFLIFGKKLSKAESWDDLIEPIGGYLSRIFPLQRIYLGVHNPELNTFQIVASKIDELSLIEDVDIDILDCLDELNLDSNGRVRATDDSPLLTQISSQNMQSYRYCFPMAFDDVVFAFLIFDVSATINLASKQIYMVSRIFPEISMAVAHVYSLEYYFDQSKSRQKERKKIARVLHDTLVQDISYLKLKLDLLREQDSLIGILEVQRDLDRMKSVAQSAYEQVRGTLESLVVDAPQDISKAIQLMANSIYESASVEVRINETGTPQPLSSITRKKIINIAREALANIEKHSQSPTADVEINWSENKFVMKITDYGVGISKNVCDNMQHYGIIFMQERADAINAGLEIGSTPGEGTTITLSLKLTPTVLVSG